MAWRRCIAVVTVLAAAGAGQGRVPMHDAKAYAPVRGTRWVYEQRAVGATKAVTVRCTNELRRGRVLVRELETEDVYPTYVYLGFGADGISFSFARRQPTVRGCGGEVGRLAAFPVGAETCWAWNTKTPPLGLPLTLRQDPRTATSAAIRYRVELLAPEEEVAVPAGRFSVFTVRLLPADDGEAGFVETLSFAPGAGIVRRTVEFRDGTGDRFEVLRERLAEFHPPPEPVDAVASVRGARAVAGAPEDEPIELLDDLAGLSFTTVFARVRTGSCWLMFAVRGGMARRFDPGNAAHVDGLLDAERVFEGRSFQRSLADFPELILRLRAAADGHDPAEVVLHKREVSGGDRSLSARFHAEVLHPNLPSGAFGLDLNVLDGRCHRLAFSGLFGPPEPK